MPDESSQRARTRSRELALQALYQAQIAGHDKQELLNQFRDRDEYRRVDQSYFETVLSAVCDEADHLSALLVAHADRPLEQLDPIERAILLMGCYELESRADVPRRAVINEAVNLAKRFGAEDGYKYVNAVLDRASRTLRPAKPS